MKDYKNIFSIVLTELMQEKEISCLKLSKKIGVSNSAVNGWKNGYNLPYLKSVLKLVDFFHTSIDYMFEKASGRYFMPLRTDLDIYNILIRLVKEKEISQKRFLEKCQINKVELYSWKNSYTPTLYSLLQISDYLELPIEYIIGRTDKTVL